MTTLFIAALAVVAVLGGVAGFKLGQWSERARPTRKSPRRKQR